jgi:4-hydroxybenzoate polyprenyltransferase
MMTEGRRPKWRAYLLLSRISNLPTVWSNVIAGAVASGAAFSPFDIGRLAAGVSFLYTAGMLLNDLFDRDFDTKYRPDRPLAAGDVAVIAVMRAAIILMAFGVGFIASHSGALATLPWSGALVLTIVYYNWRHKRDPLGPLWMGICRGLVYCVAAAAVASTVSARVGVAAAVMTLYVLVLTLIAKRLGQRARVVVPLLLAGISVVDAIVVTATGGPLPLALLAIVCGVLTLGLQRVVPGT